MKRNKNKIKLLLGFGLLFSSVTAFSQEVYVLDDGEKQIECVNEEHYQTFMKPLLEQKIAELEAEGKIEPKNSAKMGGAVKLNWPLRMADNYKEENGVYSYWYISNFADLNDTEDEDGSERLDWVCNTGTSAKNYDQHNGVDIVPYPYPWQMMDDESVDVIAAADGEVIHIFDGNTFDRNCEKPHSFISEPFNDGYYGNFVAIRHSDYTISIYAHMKNGTVANLEDGDDVVAGQYLGKIGSSGNSTAPHLHFEYRFCEACSYTEPWFDPEGCNDDIFESVWIDQVPFYEPQILRVSTHDALPVSKSCSEYEDGENETLNIANHIGPFSTFYVGVAMRDFLIGDGFSIDIINSSGTIVDEADYIALENFEKNSFYFSFNLITSGTYTVRVSHDGKNYYHFFTINCPAATTLSGSHTGVKAYINGDNITSTATISGLSSNNVLYQAENYVKLNVGFKATQNCQFLAQIDDCTIGGLKLEDETAVLQLEQINIFPNPNFGIFTLQYVSSELSDMQIFVRNTLGEIIFTSESYNMVNAISETIDISSQPKGIYFIELKENNKVHVQKVIIQ